MSEQPETSPAPPALRLWQRVEAERRARDWSLEKIAEYIGIRRSTIARLKTNKTTPLTTTVEKIARAFDIDPEVARDLAGLPALGRPATTSDILDQAEALAEQVKTELLRRVESMSYEERVRWLRQLGKVEMPVPEEVPAPEEADTGPDADIA